MKVWCEKCKGSGDREYDWFDGSIVKTCEVCAGSGYTESEKPTTEINIDYYNELKAKADKWYVKETRKKITRNTYGVVFCPVCKSSVWQNKDESNYCFRCGQRITFD